MAGAVENKHSHSLKEALIESLTHVLSSDHEIRLSGENQVKVLEVTEGCWIVMLVLSTLKDTFFRNVWSKGRIS